MTVSPAPQDGRGQASASQDGESPAIAAVILAAGGSSRLGQPKQLLAYGGKSLLRRAGEAAVDSGCSPVLAVVGANAERMREELTGLPATIVENAAWERGMGASIKAGMSAVAADPRVSASLLLLCDQPRVSCGVLRSLISSFAQSEALVAASAYAGSLGTPALFSRTLFEELLSLDDDEGAKRLIRRHAASSVTVPFPEGAFDIDTPDDAARLRREDGRGE
jgi:molybdenum cofactor cytidylyltransferase